MRRGGTVHGKETILTINICGRTQTSKQTEETKSFTKVKDGESSSSSRILKTGMIEKKPRMETKGVRDDIEEEDEEESYYRYEI